MGLGASPEGYAILAMGKLGSGELNHFSDLDLIFVWDERLAAADKLAQAGIIVEEASPDFGGVGQAFQTLRAVDFSTGMEVLLKQHRDKLKPDVIWNIEKGLALKSEEIGKAALRRAWSSLAMVSYGAYVHHCKRVADELEQE